MKSTLTVPFDHPGIAHAFDLEISPGVVKSYYEWADVFNEPALRALTALDLYSDMERKISGEQCIQIFQKIQALCNAHSPERNTILEIYHLAQVSLEKCAWLVNTDLVWRLAACVYFDETENPLEHDQAYGDVKIALWKKDLGITELVKKKSFRDFFPFLNTLNIDLKTLSAVQEKMDPYLSKLVSSSMPA